MCRLRIWRCRSTVYHRNRWYILHGTVRTHEARCGSLCICVCSKFPGVCFCQELTKLDDIGLSDNKYKKGDVLFETQCSLNHKFIYTGCKFVWRNQEPHHATKNCWAVNSTAMKTARLFKYIFACYTSRSATRTMYNWPYSSPMHKCSLPKRSVTIRCV